MKMTGAIEVSQRFDPYVRVPGASQPMDAADSRSETVRALLLDRTVEQVRSIIAAVDRGDMHLLPLVLRGLDQETEGLFTRRVVAMLAAYERFLTQTSHADAREALDVVFRPIGDWVGGQYVVTSPALLVVQTILYSHCEWFHEYLWEAKSAIRAYRELHGAISNQRSTLSPAHAQFVAGIIAHQTLLRTTWSTGSDDVPEAYAFYEKTTHTERGGKSHPTLAWAEEEYNDPEKAQAWSHEAAGMALARTLFKFLPAENDSDKRRLSAALILHALCLHGRHGRLETDRLSESRKIKHQALRFLDYLRLPTGARYQPRLAFLQYGRYVLASENSKGSSGLFAAAKKRIIEAKDPLLPLADIARGNLMFVFQRVSSLRVWRDQRFDENNVKPLDLAGSGAASDAIERMVAETVGKAVCFRLPPEGYVKSSLGV